MQSAGDGQMENIMTLTIDSVPSLKASHLSQETAGEVRAGIKIGAIHTVPLLVSFLAASVLMPSVPGIYTGALPLAAALQFLVPSTLLAQGNKKFHKNTMKFLSTSLFLAGISNGVILAILTR
jgi:hypothetical protein